MPYFQRSWYKVLGDSAPAPVGHLRTIPLIDSPDVVQAAGLTRQQSLSKEPAVARDEIEFTAEQVRERMQQLCKQVHECWGCKCCEQVTTTADDRVGKYALDKSDAGTVFRGMFSAVYRCKDTSNAAVPPLVCRVYKPTANLNPDNEYYLKILRHISTGGNSKAPPTHVIDLADMFIDQEKHIFLVYDYADAGNVMAYMTKGNFVSEDMMRSWSRHIYAAMDYLGTKGVTHRSIYPKHFLLASKSSKEPKDFEVKLGGFRDAIMYWDPKKNDINYQKCRPLNKEKGALNFHAPEMFGSDDCTDEYYDPVAADIWSFGTSMFFLMAREYPFKIKEPGLEAQIRNAIASLAVVSNDCKYWLFGIMHPNTAERTEFEDILDDAFFTE